jgi:serine/threonine-protein kinase
MVKPGTPIGVYEVVSLLGSGGMGEVYRARDERLKRDVALKILPESFAGDPERLARFQREAQVLAALNHPHVADIYGLEESNGYRALVLELVEGETLADRIARGAIPVDEALPLARQIVEALEYAHEHGVVHRDLKPSNIKITPDGTVKVLDFGLAKLADSSIVLQPDSSTSPTIAAVSQVGVLLGTAAYMSPEQARLKAADKRGDVWAFGCVLYEMLTGRRAFEGDEVTDILANVLKASPDWTRLPANIPPSIRTLLRRCLEKDRAHRLPDIGSARLEIADAIARRDESAAPTTVRVRRAQWLPWTIAATAAIATVVAIALWAPWRSAPALATTRVNIDLGANVSLIPVGAPSAVISPDGNTLVFVGQPANGPRQLYVRRLNQLQATPLAGTAGAVGPFFSPDGKWIGFSANNRLRKIVVTGGAAVTLAEGAAGIGATWTDRDTIIYVPQVGELREVSSQGGTPSAVAVQVDGAAPLIPLFPASLPGSNAILYTALAGAGQLAEASVVAQVLPGGEPQVLVRGATFGRYVESGHLLYLTQGTMFAAPFDVKTLKITGNAVPVIDEVQFDGANGGAQFAVSRTGTLVFTPGGGQTVERPMSWLDQRGRITPINTSALGRWGTPRFAPDGRRVAITRVSDRGDLDIWTYDLDRDSSTRITFEASVSAAPVWTADGRRIAYGSSGVTGAAPLNLYWKRADGTGEAPATHGEQGSADPVIVASNAPHPCLPRGYSTEPSASPAARVGR